MAMPDRSSSRAHVSARVADLAISREIGTSPGEGTAISREIASNVTNATISPPRALVASILDTVGARGRGTPRVAEVRSSAALHRASTRSVVVPAPPRLVERTVPIASCRCGAQHTDRLVCVWYS
ncbi:hypothetical protein [Saccharopolyspora sp. 5N708]|uniref:hypothetical protein n=1 Tax=Saccharopolyspora sp. 5N708 TaxID=3457424 RepID=UPI003FD4D2DA